jgi:nickel-dependent lactate racemase
VVAVAPYPMDINLYQSQKAIDNSKLALNANGILILVASCRKGVGGESFMKLLSEARNPDDVFGKIEKGYKLGYHSLWAYTKLEPQLLENIFVKGFSDLQEALNSALKEKGNEKILFLMDASLTVPRIAPRILHKRKFIHSPTFSTKVKSRLVLDDLFVD